MPLIPPTDMLDKIGKSVSLYYSALSICHTILYAMDANNISFNFHLILLFARIDLIIYLATVVNYQLFVIFVLT